MFSRADDGRVGGRMVEVFAQRDEHGALLGVGALEALHLQGERTDELADGEEGLVAVGARGAVGLGFGLRLIGEAFHFPLEIEVVGWARASGMARFSESDFQATPGFFSVGGGFS